MNVAVPSEASDSLSPTGIGITGTVASAVPPPQGPACSVGGTVSASQNSTKPARVPAMPSAVVLTVAVIVTFEPRLAGEAGGVESVVVVPDWTITRAIEASGPPTSGCPHPDCSELVART